MKKRRKAKRIAGIVLVIFALLIVAFYCFDLKKIFPTSEMPNISNQTTNKTAGIANPASVYCIQHGYNLSIRADEKGNQYGVCIFDDGSECEEWAFYRGECEQGEQFNITK